MGATQTFLLIVTTAEAGPPFLTDDPVPVALNNWEINTAFTGTLAGQGAALATPSIDINYGLFPGVHLHLQPQLSTTWNSQGTGAGIGDAQIGVKIRLWDQDRSGWLPMLALYPQMNFASGNAARGLGTGTNHAFLPVWLQRDIGKWSLIGGLGYCINPGSTGRNAWYAGGLVLYQISDTLQLGGELFEQQAQARGQPDAPGFNLGGTYDLNATYHILFSAGQGIAHISAADRSTFYLGLQVTF